MALVNIYVGCGLDPNPPSTRTYSPVSCASACDNTTCDKYRNLSGITAVYSWVDCNGVLHFSEAIGDGLSICAASAPGYVSGGTLTAEGSCNSTEAIFTLCDPVDIGCIFYYASGPREGFMVDPGYYSDGTNCYEIIRGPKFFSELIAITNCGSAPGACVEYLVTNFSGVQEGVNWTNCASGLPQSEFLDPSTNTSFCSSTFPVTSADVQTVGPCAVVCDDYFNNTGNALTGISYIACGGGEVTNATVNPGQSICIAPGTGGGGDFGFLTLLGNC
jgi:hypothetical protein